MDGAAAEKVEENCDLLIDILVRLPGKTLCRFKTVSKRWRDLISDPFFVRSQVTNHSSSSGCLLAFFQRTSMLSTRKYLRPAYGPLMNILPVLQRSINNTPHKINKNVPRRLGYFMNSSGGLILCGRHPAMYHVLNPVAKRWVSLPPPRVTFENSRESTAGLMMCGFEDSRMITTSSSSTGKVLTPSYVVIRAPITNILSKHLQIETYSSKTGEWVESMLVGTQRFFLHHDEPPLAANGVFHWYTGVWEIAVYDPNDSSDNLVQLIEMPYSVGDDDIVSSRTITRSSKGDDVLWLGMITYENMRFYMLPKKGTYKRGTTITRDEWVPVYKMSVASLLSLLVPHAPEYQRILDEFDKDAFKDNVIRMEGFIPTSDPLVVVLNQGGRVFLFNIESTSIEPVRYYGRPNRYQLHHDDLCPYVEPSSLSSYFL